MLDDIFPSFFMSILHKTPIDKLNEIRLRVNKKIVLCIAGKSYYLGPDGLTGNIIKAITAEKSLIDDIIKRACENSVYAYSEQIKNGFLTVRGGARIGLAGEGVYEKNFLKTIKNISALSIRIPHEIENCSASVMNYLVQSDFKNTLVLSPPGCGKTTLIRDILCQLSNKNYCYNVLLVDERYEIANCFNGVPTLNVGNFCDILSGINKAYAFENGIRSMRPDIIVTDEIATEKDCEAIIKASCSGVKILASVHAQNIDDLKAKPYFEQILKNKIFDRFVVLSSREGLGTIEGVFDKDMRCISY